jgi:hypothetical protein
LGNATVSQDAFIGCVKMKNPRAKAAIQWSTRRTAQPLVHPPVGAYILHFQASTAVLLDLLKIKDATEEFRNHQRRFS